MASSYVCFYTRCPHTEFRWIMTKAVAILGDDNDMCFTRTVKDILDADGFVTERRELLSDSFRVVHGLDLSPEIDENSETEVFYTFRDWMFSAYPEWFSDTRCSICHGQGSYRESHGNPNWSESITCECCNIDNDDFIRSQL